MQLLFWKVTEIKITKNTKMNIEFRPITLKSKAKYYQIAWNVFHKKMYFVKKIDMFNI